jgi:aspartate kinase
MSLVVMKFGGSSVADANKIKQVAAKVIAKKNDGNKVVVVVSAPGDTTDDLIKMSDKIALNPPAREKDMLLATGEMVSISLLAMAVNVMGEKAVSMTGPQAGILASENYGCAKIKKIVPHGVRDKLAENNIVIVAGFQALNPKGDITTLGRGGSDLTAVALAVALEADMCEIYSDVEGVYTADPRVVKDARKIDCISYDEMLEMAGSGAQVLQSRSVEVAKKFGLEIHSRSTFSENQGTVITSEEKIRRKNMESFLVSGIPFDKEQAKFSITVSDSAGIVAKIFSQCAKAGVKVDIISQLAGVDKKTVISFTVNRQDVRKAWEQLNRIASDYKASVLCNEHVAKVSVVGTGIKTNAEVTARVFEILHKSGIDIEMISTSEIRISCIVNERDVLKAVEELHRGFGLSRQ